MAVPTIYIVSDMRTVWDSANGNYAVLTNTTQHHTRTKAEARYHSALASAANSETIERWSAVLMTNEGFVLASQSYDHVVAPPEPEPEPEQESDSDGSEDDGGTDAQDGGEDGSESISVPEGGYSAMTKHELYLYAQQRGITVYESWTKADIIAAIEAADAEEA